MPYEIYDDKTGKTEKINVSKDVYESLEAAGYSYPLNKREFLADENQPRAVSQQG